MTQDEMKAFARKHRVPLIVGAVVVAVLMASGGGNQAPPQQQGFPVGQDGLPVVPVDGGGGTGPVTGGDGTIDMDRWRREQDRDDNKQEERIDRIYEEETCVDPDTGERIKVPISVGCPS